MYVALKIGALVVYAIAAAAALGALPGSLGAWMVKLALLLLVLHVLELPIAFKHLKKYQGPLAVSVLLSLLFGFLHWLPLSKQP
jgi:hypothetical protein